MKYIYVLAVLICFSCSSVHYIPKERGFFGIDFRKYTSLGFFITPEKYSGEYASIGIVSYVIIPAAAYVVTQTYMGPNNQREEVRQWRVEQVDIAEGLDSLYSIAKRMGADAVINFKADTEVREHTAISNPVIVTGYRLSGFAIKRKQD